LANALVLLLAACSTSSSNAGSGAPAGTPGCQAACARCGSDFCLDCAATSAKYRDEFETSLYACVQEVADASCGTLWTSCAIKAESEAARRPIDDTYRDACLAKKKDCDAQGAGFADDDCLISSILEQALVMQAQDCLAKACADAKSCLQPIFK
jgi:hypothetical protein